MKGTLVNAAAILVGSSLGLLLKKGIPETYQKTIVKTLGLAVSVIGIEMALKTSNIMIVITSLIIGAICGEFFDLDGKINKLGNWLTAIFKKINHNKDAANSTDIGEGFVTASLLYCIGAMAVIGSIQDGLTGDTKILYAKSLLDGTMSIALSATLGIGVALSSISVLIYQGFFTLIAGILAPFLSDFVINELAATGGVLIIGIALILLEATKIKLANLLPAIPAAIIVAYLWSF